MIDVLKEFDENDIYVSGMCEDIEEREYIKALEDEIREEINPIRREKLKRELYAKFQDKYVDDDQE